MKKIVILGAAESGVGAAILAKEKDFEVFLSDNGGIKEKYKATLDKHQINWEENGHTPSKILDADIVIKSPGIPQTAPMVKDVYAKGIKIISDIEFAARYTDATLIAITGSNGKTTTTTLLTHILKSAGLDALATGNIGNSLAMHVAHTPHQYYVIELSSFQLEDMYEFHPRISILLNITPDHLDRYEFSMEKYAQAKMRITQNLNIEDCFIYSHDDPNIQQQLKEQNIHCKLYPFADTRSDSETDVTAYTEGDEICIEAPQKMRISMSQLQITGKHNMRNVMAAVSAALELGVDCQRISEALQSFTGIEHRMEPAGEIDGVNYINDSKATNVDACLQALASIAKNIILIIGGKDKGNDYTPLMPLIRERCKTLVFLGADNTKLKEAFAEIDMPKISTHDMKSCVEACRQNAAKGDTVLLSPCCASFDLFKNMEDRGEQFKVCVKNIKK